MFLTALLACNVETAVSAFVVIIIDHVADSDMSRLRISAVVCERKWDNKNQVESSRQTDRLSG